MCAIRVRVPGVWAAIWLSFSLTEIWSVAVLAQSSFRGHYEVRVSWGSSASRATWSYEVAAGETIQIDLDGNSVLATVQPLSDRDYDLHVAVKRDVGGVDMALVAPISSNVRRAAFGEAVELTEREDAVTLPGGVVISVLRLWE